MSKLIWIIFIGLGLGEFLLAGQQEGCLSCHSGMKGFSPFHDVQRLGCVSCHLGNPGTKEKESAHAKMVVVPGNVTDVSRTCGQAACHPTLANRLHHNLMTTGRGIVAVNRWVFGEASTPDGPGHLSQLDTTGADLHLRQLCATCHLAFPKKRPAPISQKSRGGGCVACHLQYSPKARQQWKAYRKGGAVPTVHPTITLKVEDRHCFGCHSRSGRISTNYQGWHETLLKALPESAHQEYWRLEDGRIFRKQPADVHFQKGLQCIDCHTWQEVMGDGQEHVHEEDQQVIECTDCHRVAPPQRAPASAFSIIDWKLLTLRGISLKQLHPIVTHQGEQVMYNVGVDAESQSLILIAKNTGKRFPLAPPSERCTRTLPGHEHVSCQSCHTAWAPRCIACHVGYNPQRQGRDHLTGRTTRGRWVEYRAEFQAGFPTLGMVMGARGNYRIEPFVPGMILTIDFHQQAGDKPMRDFDRFQRLFAPVAPHTTQAKGVACQTCHANPVALGYGAGKLTLRVIGQGKWAWHFDPTYGPHPADGLPLDAWIPFGRKETGKATRMNARSLPLEMQKRILIVGACLQCHPFQPQKSGFYQNFSQQLNNLTSKCRLPVFEWE